MNYFIGIVTLISIGTIGGYKATLCDQTPVLEEYLAEVDIKTLQCENEIEAILGNKLSSTGSKSSKIIRAKIVEMNCHNYLANLQNIYVTTDSSENSCKLSSKNKILLMKKTHFASRLVLSKLSAMIEKENLSQK